MRYLLKYVRKYKNYIRSNVRCQCKENNKTVTASPDKMCDEVNLLVTTTNITKSPHNVSEASNSSSMLSTTINAFNIDLDAPIPN